MISGRTIVCIGSEWDYDPTSKHHIMKVLSRRNEVLWVNYRGTRRPRLNRADLSAGWSALRRMMRGAQIVHSNFRQMTPLVIPGARYRWMQRLHRQLLIQQIRDALADLSGGGDRPLQIWSFAPDVSFLAGAFGEECFVYYCVDDHARFDGVDAERIRRAEHDMLDRASLVIATSETLQEAKRLRRPDAILVRHGVDYERFASAWRTPTIPHPDLADIARPIFGFFGLIQSWIDLPLLSAVAAMRPHYSFVLLGECQRDVSRTAALPNVHFLGRKPHAALPAYCAAFSAGLMPFITSPFTRSINPIKMYEYLAAGLPVVSTPLPEAERFAGPVTIVRSAAEFAAACDRVVETDHPARRAEISAAVQSESWETKVEFLSELVMRCVRRGAAPVSMPRRHVTPLRIHENPALTGASLPRGTSAPAAIPAQPASDGAYDVRHADPA